MGQSIITGFNSDEADEVTLPYGALTPEALAAEGDKSHDYRSKKGLNLEHSEHRFLEAMRHSGSRNALPAEGATQCEALAALREAALKKCGSSESTDKVKSRASASTSAPSHSSKSSSLTQSSVASSGLCAAPPTNKKPKGSSASPEAPPRSRAYGGHVPEQKQKGLSAQPALGRQAPAQVFPVVDEEDEDWLLLEVLKLANLGDKLARSGGLQRKSLKALRHALLQEVGTIVQSPQHPASAVGIPGGLTLPKEAAASGTEARRCQTQKPQRPASTRSLQPGQTATLPTPPTPKPDCPPNCSIQQEEVALALEGVAAASGYDIVQPATVNPWPKPSSEIEDSSTTSPIPQQFLDNFWTTLPGNSIDTKNVTELSQENPQAPAPGKIPLPYNMGTNVGDHQDLVESSDSPDLEVIHLSL